MAVPNDSRQSQLKAMAVGESIALAERIPLKDADLDSILDIRKRLNSRLRQLVARASAGNEYVIESIDNRTRSGYVLIASVVTRIQ
jgi:hypothetical protein